MTDWGTGYASDPSVLGFIYEGLARVLSGFFFFFALFLSVILASPHIPHLTFGLKKGVNPGKRTAAEFQRKALKETLLDSPDEN